ncbi:MAG: DUF4159 domain-containing protein [Acidobacteriota bacterium]|nr:DUF4159 domain-containing protein [Acidobacteriota bacterium]
MFTRPWIVLLLAWSSGFLWAQSYYDYGYSDYGNMAVVNPWDEGVALDLPRHTFTFARIHYKQRNEYGWGWRTDYPDSDINFSLRLSELTTIQVNRDRHGRIIHAVIELGDDRLFSFPFIYMVEVGNLYLDKGDAGRLREYLLRGGFLLVDDFWGGWDWDNWVEQIRKAFPDASQYPMYPISLDHPIYHTVFDLDEVPQVPSINNWLRYGTSSENGEDAEAYGLFNPEGRLMAVVLHNTDLGDGWEREGVDYEYFRKFSVGRAYPLGINIVVYAMTH